MKIDWAINPIELKLAELYWAKIKLKKYVPVFPFSSPSHQLAFDSSIKLMISPDLNVNSLSSAASKSYKAQTFLPAGELCRVE